MKPDWCDEATWNAAWVVVSNIQMKDMKLIPEGWQTFESMERVARALIAARNEGMEEAARIVDEGFERVGLTGYKCSHDRSEWEDCEQCASAAIRSRIQKEG